MADSFGGVTTSTFDARGRLSGREWGGGGVTAGSVTFAYDDRGSQTGSTRKTGASVAATTTVAYDAVGRVTGERHATAGGGTIWLGTYAWDFGDRLTSKTEAGATTSYPPVWSNTGYCCGPDFRFFFPSCRRCCVFRPGR